MQDTGPTVYIVLMRDEENEHEEKCAIKDSCTRRSVISIQRICISLTRWPSLQALEVSVEW